MDTEWIPPEIDSQKPSVARVYDYLLGGSHNFTSDRDLATGLLRIEPQAREIARANRAFLGRAACHLVESGIDQFIDIGSGIPTQGNVHEITQRLNPESTVVYVDSDPVAVAHSRVILTGNERAAVVQADMRRPDDILGDPTVRALIDFDRPIGLLMVASLHLIKAEEDPYGIVAAMRDVAAPGSHLVISHLTHDSEAGKAAAIEKLYTRATNPAVARSRVEIERFFDGFELLEPGIVGLPWWRPEDGPLDGDPGRFLALGGVGRKN